MGVFESMIPNRIINASNLLCLMKTSHLFDSENAKKLAMDDIFNRNLTYSGHVSIYVPATSLIFESAIT